MTKEQLEKANRLQREITRQEEYLSHLKMIAGIDCLQRGSVEIIARGVATPVPYEVINKVAVILSEKVECILLELRKEFEAL